MANADGSDERVLRRRTTPSLFVTLRLIAHPGAAPVWSPDGSRLAVFGSNGGVDGTPHVLGINLTDNSEHVIDLEIRGGTRGLGWLDNRTLIINQWAGPGAPGQLFRVDYSTGVRRQLTNDLNGYAGISLTSDRRTLATCRTDTRASVWVSQTAGLGDWKEVVSPTPFGSTSPAAARVSWAGRQILYSKGTLQGFAVFRTSPGEHSSAEIVPRGQNAYSTSDGGTIIFDRGDTGLWKADGEGHPPVKILDRDVAVARLTPDDRHIVFLSTRNGLQTPWMMPLAGGTPTQIVNKFAGAESLDVSPDGKSILFTSLDDQRRPSLVICDLPTCQHPRVLPPVAGFRRLRWAPDGKGVAYTDENGGANVWIQPFDGSPARKLTAFNDQVIGDFAWSRDGSQLALTRVSISNDIVLLKGLVP